MKTFATIIALVIIAFANAQDNKETPRNQTSAEITVAIATTTTIAVEDVINTDSLKEENTELVKLYKNRNALVKRELNFRTKAHKSLMA